MFSLKIRTMWIAFCVAASSSSVLENGLKQHLAFLGFVVFFQRKDAREYVRRKNTPGVIYNDITSTKLSPS